MHHAVPDEPVMRVEIDVTDRVGSIADVAAGQLGGDLADHLQVGLGELGGQRGEVALLDIEVRAGAWVGDGHRSLLGGVVDEKSVRSIDKISVI